MPTPSLAAELEAIDLSRTSPSVPADDTTAPDADPRSDASATKAPADEQLAITDDAPAAEAELAEAVTPVADEAAEPAVADPAPAAPAAAATPEPAVADDQLTIDAATPADADDQPAGAATTPATGEAEPSLAEAIAETEAAPADEAPAPAADEPADEPSVAAESAPAEPAEPVPALTGFAALGLRPELLGVLEELEYSEPTPIQREAIPPTIVGKDLLGQAATGTGKTAAFALPVLQRLADLSREERKLPTTLVLTPTRELAVQVAKAFASYGKPVGARVVAVYGGQSLRPQLAAFAKGVDVIVATPGRALDHIKRGALKTHALHTVVLDEADEMLDMGFTDDLEAILAAAPAERQTVLFSATMPPRLERIARSHLKDPVRLRLQAEERAEGEAPQVREQAFVVAKEHVVGALGRILALEDPTAALVFCHTRDEVDEIAEDLGRRGHRTEALHGGMTQEQRDRAMGRLRAGTVTLLVATDVAARGLDVDHLTHVVNVGVPQQPEAYVHRIGRVGRAGREGVALTIVDPRGMSRLRQVQKLTRREVPLTPVPQPADLERQRLARLRLSLTAAEPTDQHAALADELVAAGQDPVELLAAALRLADQGTATATDTEHVPEFAERFSRGKPTPGHRGKPWEDRGERPAGKGKPWESKGPRKDGPPRGDGPRGQASAGPGRTNLWIGMGTEHKLRPQDLVGAICGESSLAGEDIGAIKLSERYSLVAVPTAKADEVVQALSATRIKGRKAKVRRERA